MTDFFTFAYELLWGILIQFADFFVAVGQAFYGVILLFPKSFNTIKSYSSSFSVIEWVCAILLLALIVSLIGLLLFKLFLLFKMKWKNRSLEIKEEDLLTEIAGLNRQVAELIDEKSQILSMKVSQLGLSPDDDGSQPADGTMYAGHGDKDQEPRFAKLAQVDEKYAQENQSDIQYDNEIKLDGIVERYRMYAASKLKLYYDACTIRMFIAGMASTKILILEGISGTGKTSLPYSFSKFLHNNAGIVSVQPSFRDRTELLGYFNEFTKRFNETEFLRYVYTASYEKSPCFIVLDEMNLARIEYYFAELLSVLEMPTPEEWVIDLVPTAWDSDPKKLANGKMIVPTNLWFVGTANNDDSTFTITDKVYDRAIPISLDRRCNPFEAPDTEPVHLEASYLQQLFDNAVIEHQISPLNSAKLEKLDQYLQTRFKMAVGNRIAKQMEFFIPVYVACGGTEMEAVDYIVERKILKKFESMNISFLHDEMKELSVFIDKTFGKTGLIQSKKYLQKLQTMF